MTILSIVFALTTIQTTHLNAADGLSDDPYPVFVTFDSAYARCGPSHDYYRTDSLRQGQELEVYVETEDGWLGVRPPENSFCWIPASAVKAEKRGTIATVVEDRTVAWIGTHLGRAKRYRWQVQLAEGESVTVIGRSERDGPDGPQMWYRIVPPSGEFRWIHRDQIATSAEELVAAIDRNRKNQPAESRQRMASAVEENTTPKSRSRLGDLGQSILSLAGAEEAPKRSAPEKAAVVRAAGPSPRQADATPQYDGRPDSSRRTASTLQPIVSTKTIPLQSAPRPADRRPLAQAPIPAAPTQTDPAQSGTVGSGLNERWQNNQVRQSVADNLGTAENAVREHRPIQNPIAPEYNEPRLAKADFVSRPRLTDIGISTDAAAPLPSERATDSNWIIGSARQNVAGFQQGTQPGTQQGIQEGAVAQANGQMIQGNPQYGMQTQNIQQVAGQYAGQFGATQQAVSPDAIAAVELKTRGADVGQLQLILSRLMASRGTSAEAQPIADAASQITATTTDELLAARARLLSERVQQYQRVAQRRDATMPMNPVQPASFRGAVTTTPQISHDAIGNQNAIGNTGPAMTSNQVANPNIGRVPSSSSPSVTGYLVQVYSARPNSPPYALTDHSGNTISYVTPAPGTNIRHHINSYITVTGNKGFLAGLNTPHVLANRAFRAVE